MKGQFGTAAEPASAAHSVTRHARLLPTMALRLRDFAHARSALEEALEEALEKALEVTSGTELQRHARRSESMPTSHTAQATHSADCCHPGVGAGTPWRAEWPGGSRLLHSCYFLH